MPAMVFSMEAACVDNAILLDYMTSKVVLEEPEIGRTDSHIPIDNDFIYDKQHFAMAGGSEDYEDEGDRNIELDAIPTSSR
jgi:hypothetical protein